MEMPNVFLDNSIFGDVAKLFLTYRAPFTHRHDNKSQKNEHMKLTLQQARYFCKTNEMFKTAQECICEKQETLSTIVHTSFHV
jgi:hypothetical protein